MKVISPEEYKKRYGEEDFTRFVGTPAEKEGGYFSRVGNQIKGNFNEAVQSEKSSIAGTMNPLAAGANIAKNISSAIISPVAQAPGFKQVGEGFGKIGQAVADTEPMQRVIDLMSKHPELAGAVADTLETGLNVAGIEGTVKTFRGGVNYAKEAANSIKLKAPALDGIPDIETKITDFISRDPEVKTATILRESSKATFDKYINTAKEAMADPRKQTPYELVGENMTDALKEIKRQANEIGAKKSEYLKPMQGGLDWFEPNNLVNDLVVLKNKVNIGSKNFIQGIIDKAKQIKTKGGADRFIDDMDQELYGSEAQKVVPEGSPLEKQVRGILGKFNNELKSSLPKEYSNLNAEYSRYMKIIKTMNRALGQTVEGVPVRGASLVKQFFSPSGTMAKELFDFVKEKTGIDLAQDTTLARFAMEMFDDPRARALLEGIPTSPRGLVEKGIDVLVDKTGLGKKFQESLRNSEIRKARQQTK